MKHLDIEALIRKHDNVVRIVFGDNGLRSDALYKKAYDLPDNEALPLYHEALALNPKHDLAWTNIGNIFFNKGNYAKARACWDRALEINPIQAEAHYNIGYALFELKKYGEAADRFRFAIGADPKFADAYYSLGMVYTHLGDAKRGREALETYLTLEPDTAHAKNVRKMLGKKRR